MPNVELSVEELTTLHEALKRCLQPGTNGRPENGNRLPNEETIRRCEALHQRVHKILAWGFGVHLQHYTKRGSAPK